MSVITLLVLGSQGAAQKKPTPKPAQPHATEQPKTQVPGQPPRQASPPQVVMPDTEKIVMLVRNTLITLNDAIQTGNFTVLRDRGTPGFRDANSAAGLSKAFSDLASRDLDLSVVSILTPELTEAPTLDREKGMLNIKGYFPTRPVQIDFELLYQSIGGRWRLFGLSVQPGHATQSPQSSSGNGHGSAAETKKPSSSKE